MTIPFKNNKNIGKAVSRQKCPLPMSLQKKKAAIKKLFDSEISKTDTPSFLLNTDNSKCMSIETVNLNNFKFKMMWADRFQAKKM